MNAPLLSADGISKTYSSAGRRVAALDVVSFGLSRGETLGLVDQPRVGVRETREPEIGRAEGDELVRPGRDLEL